MLLRGGLSSPRRRSSVGTGVQGAAEEAEGMGRELHRRQSEFKKIIIIVVVLVIII